MILKFYKPLEQCPVISSEWLKCGCCGDKPHLWLFDNGEFAKCLCDAPYGSSAQGISLWDYHKLHNGDMTHWNHNDLRDKWNIIAKQRLPKDYSSTF